MEPLCVSVTVQGLCCCTHFHVLWIVPNTVTHSACFPAADDPEHQQRQSYSHPLSSLPCALLEVSLRFMSHYASCEAERTPSSLCALLCKHAIPLSDTNSVIGWCLLRCVGETPSLYSESHLATCFSIRPVCCDTDHLQHVLSETWLNEQKRSSWNQPAVNTTHFIFPQEETRQSSVHVEQTGFSSIL